MRSCAWLKTCSTSTEVANDSILAEWVAGMEYILDLFGINMKSIAMLARLLPYCSCCASHHTIRSSVISLGHARNSIKPSTPFGFAGVDGKTESSGKGLLHTPLRDLGMQGKKRPDRCI